VPASQDGAGLVLQGAGSEHHPTLLHPTHPSTPCRTRPTPPLSRTSRRATCGSTPTTSTGTTACCPRWVGADGWVLMGGWVQAGTCAGAGAEAQQVTWLCRVGESEEQGDARHRLRCSCVCCMDGCCVRCRRCSAAASMRASSRCCGAPVCLPAEPPSYFPPAMQTWEDPAHTNKECDAAVSNCCCHLSLLSLLLLALLCRWLPAGCQPGDAPMKSTPITHTTVG